MALTGTGIRIGTVTEFGVSVRFPRGLASDGTTLRLFDANKGYTLDLSTGIATPIGTLTNFGVSVNQRYALQPIIITNSFFSGKIGDGYLNMTRQMAVQNK